MTHTQSVEITTAALGSISVNVESSTTKLDSSKTTLLLLHSFSTSTKLYSAQFDNASLNERFNLVALDEFGHGDTSGVKDDVTFWEQAELALAVMDKLNIIKAYALGTSQGGFIAARMALLAPEKIQGLVLCGTSLYSETSKLGSWTISDVMEHWIPPVTSSVPTPDFLLPQPMSAAVVVAGLGEGASQATHDLWRGVHEKVYAGDEGRRKFLMIARSLADRDNLSDEQMGSIKCPILVMHGTKDEVYSVPLMHEWADKLTGSSGVTREVVEGGSHFLAASQAKEVTAAVLQWSEKLV